MIGVAVVGAGEIAARHLAALDRVTGVEARVGAGPNPVRGERVPPWVADYREVLDRDDVAVVDVCAPADRQLEIGSAAARAGKHVLVDYLTGTSPGDADGLAGACREAGVTLTVLLSERRQPLARDLKAAVDAGKLGPLRFAHAASIWGLAPIEHEGQSAWQVPMLPELEQFLVGRATAALDLVAWLFGDRPVARVFARECSLGEPGDGSRYASVVLTFADASQAICEVGRSAGLADGTGLTRLALTGLRGSAYHEARDGDLLLGPGGMRPLIDEGVDGVASAFTEWASAFAAGRGLGFDEGRASFGLALAAAESARTGRPVEVGS